MLGLVVGALVLAVVIYLRIHVLLVIWTALNLSGLVTIIRSAISGRSKFNGAMWFMTRVFLGIKFREVEGSAPEAKGDCVFLVNHRSWADFSVDGYVTQGVTYLARNLVALVLPTMALCAHLHEATIFFNRSNRRHALYNEVGAILAARAEGERRILCYPEGHRNKLPHSLPLRPGGLKLIWESGLPAQIVMVAGKDKALDERFGHTRIVRGVTCQVYRTPPIQTRDFATPSAFIAAVQVAWDAAWATAHREGAPSKPWEPGYDGYNKPFRWGMRSDPLRLPPPRESSEPDPVDEGRKPRRK